MRKASFQRIIFYVQSIVISLCAAWAAIDYIQRVFIPDEFAISHLSALVTGSWSRPFVYRALPFWIIRGLTMIGAPLYPTTYAMMVASMCGFALALRALLRAFTKNELFAFLAACAVAPALRFALYSKFAYAYDFPVLLLFTLGLVFLARQKWRAFLITLALATLTKETALFLIVIFAFHYWDKLPRLQYWRNLAAQALVYGIIRGGLMYIFRNAPGTNIEYHIPEHIAVSQVAPALGILYLFGFFILLSMFYHWKDKPLFLRNATIILLPFLALYLYGGFPLEFRIFGECAPIVYALVVWPFGGGNGSS